MHISRDSIIVSAVRSFFKGFSGVFGILFALVMIGILFSFLITTSTTEEKTTLLIAPDATGSRKELADTTPVILRINIHGTIGSRELNANTLQAQLLDSQDTQIKKGRVKAILLHINTPGGTASDSDIMYGYLMEYKKKYKVPIYAYIEGLCASGGMYIASAADKIYSTPVGIIGSIGVIMGPAFNVYDLMEKVGVKSTTITKGKDKDMLNPYRAWKPGEDASLKVIMDHDYERFVTIVTNARPKINKEKLTNEYGAQVYDPKKAEEFGFIDVSDSTYSQALTDLTKAAGLKEKEKYQVFELKVQPSVLLGLMDTKSPLISGKIKHELQLPPEFRSEFMNRPLYLYLPGLYMMSSHE